MAEKALSAGAWFNAHLPLMQRIRYDKSEKDELTITNPEQVGSYFRYPDLTEQVVYLADTIAQTLQQDMPLELQFLVRYDEAKHALRDIADMPDKKMGAMLLFLHQNQGLFPRRRREQFAELAETEINRMQAAYRQIYELDKPTEPNKQDEPNKLDEPAGKQ